MTPDIINLLAVVLSLVALVSAGAERDASFSPEHEIDLLTLVPWL